jgi:ACS family hexuronate transporter-like MFS transporter
MDRNVLAVIASTIQKEFEWTDNDYANITICFVLSYTIMYAFSGRIIDKIGTRKSFAIFGGGWTLFSMLHAFARTIPQFGIMRFFLGIAESANFPAGVKACTEWFELKDRALAIGIFNAGTAFGAAIAVPLFSFITYYLGWKTAFFSTGVFGFVWLYFWIKYYKRPKGFILPNIKQDSSVEEIDHKKVSIKTLLSKKATWGCFCARIFIDPVTYFLLFWIPKFLQDVQGLSLTKLGVLAWLPYAAMGVGTILGGAIPKILIEKYNWDLDHSRKITMLISSLLIPIFCFFLFTGVSAIVAVALISGIMLSHGLWANITIPSEIYPKEVQATITGIGGTMGGIISIISQKIIGITICQYSYFPIFIYIGSAYFISYILVSILVGKLGRIHKFN